MAVRLQPGTMPASFVTSSRIPAQNAATIFKPLVHSPHSTPFTCGAKINFEKKKQIVFLVRKLDIQSIISMIMFTRSSERIFKPLRYIQFLLEKRLKVGKK